jgi:hypothetical protein
VALLLQLQESQGCTQLLRSTAALVTQLPQLLLQGAYHLGCRHIVLVGAAAALLPLLLLLALLAQGWYRSGCNPLALAAPTARLLLAQHPLQQQQQQHMQVQVQQQVLQRSLAGLKCMPLSSSSRWQVWQLQGRHGLACLPQGSTHSQVLVLYRSKQYSSSSSSSSRFIQG